MFETLDLPKIVTAGSPLYHDAIVIPIDACPPNAGPKNEPPGACWRHAAFERLLRRAGARAKRGWWPDLTCRVDRDRGGTGLGKDVLAR